jgi:hypothetical protein
MYRYSIYTIVGYSSSDFSPLLSLILNFTVIFHINLFLSIRSLFWYEIIENKYHITFISFKILISYIISKLKFVFEFLYKLKFRFIIMIKLTNRNNLRIRNILVNSFVKIICKTYFVYRLVLSSMISSLYHIKKSISSPLNNNKNNKFWFIHLCFHSFKALV